MTEQELRQIENLVFSGQFRHALRFLRELERQSPKDPNLFMNKGGFLIDIGTALKKPALIKEGIEACGRALTAGWFPERLLYNLGNGYSNLACLITPTKRHNPDDDLLQKAKWCHRKALEHKITNNSVLLCQLHTNLGNTYERLGRRLEALQQFNKALDINPTFGMALGNKAICLIYAAKITGAHISAMQQEAYLYLCEAVKQPIEADHRQSFSSWKKQMEERCGFTEQTISSFEEDMNSIISNEPSEFGRFYLTYCLKNDLFLNFCPKLGHGEARLEDPIFITLVTKVRDKSFHRFASYLNQIREDFLLARYFLVQAQKTSADLDFVESKIQRVDTLEYRDYNIYLELAKESFEKSVNLLDKIAFFLNDYCSVRMPDHRVSFFGNDSIWNFKDTKKGHKEPMRACMKRRKNFALYGLYDLYLDFARPIDIGGNTYPPPYSKLKRIRNSITHRYLKVYMDGLGPKKRSEDELQKKELLRECLTILRVARAAVIYLIDFVNTESEKKKEKSKGLVLPMYAFSIPKPGKARI